MQRRFRIAAAVSAAVLTASGLGLLAPEPAHAASGSTTATFTISGGVLSISVPASTVNLGTVAAGSLTASGQLGDTSVSDQRGGIAETWTLTASSTSFTTGGASAAETVTNSNVSYLAGAGTVTPALAGAFTPVPTSVTLGSPATAGAFLGTTGVSTTHWNPTISFVLSAN